MTVKLSPVFNDQSFDSNGNLLVGGLLYWYLAGTSTPTPTFTDATGATNQTNPIVLNTLGLPPSPIWLQTGQTYKAQLCDQLNVPLFTVDNIAPVNDTSAISFSEWQTYGASATYVSGTSFTVPGDATSTLTPNRRLQLSVTASPGTSYATVKTATYSSSTTLTTITVTVDSLALDTGINGTNPGYGILSASNKSIPHNIPYPPGTVCPFYQSAAPLGWTQVTTINDAFLRIVSGTGGGTGGSTAASTGVNTVTYHTHAYSHSTDYTDLSHTHNVQNVVLQGVGTPFAGGTAYTQNGTRATDGASINMNHNHTFSGDTGGNTNQGTVVFKYADFVIASYNYNYPNT